MAIKLEANYSKKIGLAGFSSHQFSVTLTTELTDLTQVQQESDRLYSLLQSSVDHSIQSVGYLPEQQNGHPKPSGGKINGNGHSHPRSPARHITPSNDWKCTVAQKDLVLKVVEENRLDKNEIENLAQKRFRKGVKELNKLEASGFITELLELYPARSR